MSAADPPLPISRAISAAPLHTHGNRNLPITRLYWFTRGYSGCSVMQIDQSGPMLSGVPTLQRPASDRIFGMAVELLRTTALPHPAACGIGVSVFARIVTSPTACIYNA